MENTGAKLLKKIEITGKIVCKTGLHIGGSYTAMNIGGVDKSVIRNPLDGKPYIPGSSLKGKLRSLLQISSGAIELLEKPIGEVKFGPTNNNLDADLFGNASGNKKDIQQKPSRLIIRDCNLLNSDILLKKTEIPYTEAKTEVIIDRITSVANPRQIERVPAGAEFNLNMILNIWSDDNEKELLNNLFKALELLHDDYLGGNGSRGYGQVSIIIDDIRSKDMNEFYGNTESEGISIKENFKEKIKKLF